MLVKVQGYSDPFVCEMKIIESDDPLRDTTCYQPPPGHRAIDHNSLTVAIQPILYPPNSPPFKSVSFQFRGQDVTWDCVKDLTEVQVEDISQSSLVN